MTVEIATLSGAAVTLPDERVAELRALTFRGAVNAPGGAAYENAQTVQNAAHCARRPGLVIGCTGVADVIDGVNLARDYDLLTAVRAGGHSVAGFSTTDGGLVLELSSMNGVWVDVERRFVRVQGGATWGDLDRETQAFGLAVPGGAVSTTGVAGLTLGGGIGWLHRKWGLACDALVGADVVTADGRLVHASASEHEDLFWALRGGGGNFGVVVNMEFKAEPLGPIVMAAAPIYAIEMADDVMRAWRSWAETVPDEVTTRAILWSMPADAALPPAVHGRDVLILGAVYAGNADKGERVLQPIREFATPLGDLSAQMPYRMFQGAFDAFFPKGEVASYWKSAYLPELGDDALDLIVDRARARTSPLTLVHVPLLGGAVSHLDPSATAFGDRSAPYMLSVDGNWTDATCADSETEWVRSFIADAAPFSTGTYLNFGGDSATDVDAVETAFGANLARLRAIKRDYDPHNLFRLNGNIPPAD